MNFLRRNQINILAEKIRLVCELITPVDVEEAVSRLGGELERDDLADYEARIEKLNDRFKITISNTEYERRKRFSIAHEIGHLFLHMGYLINKEKWEETGAYRDSVYYRYGYSLEESEANEFAAAFLMPRAEFIEVTQNNLLGGVYQIEKIAEHFDVSLESAVYRGRWLRLFSWE
jgi:Zn-dependent peptidase ImmA (M78 family)